MSTGCHWLHDPIMLLLFTRVTHTENVNFKSPHIPYIPKSVKILENIFFYSSKFNDYCHGDRSKKKITNLKKNPHTYIRV